MEVYFNVFFCWKGVEKWPDGSRYEGQFFEGKKHGKGCFTWADGSSYEGDFVENNIEGYGKKFLLDKKYFIIQNNLYC